MSLLVTSYFYFLNERLQKELYSVQKENLNLKATLTNKSKEYQGQYETRNILDIDSRKLLKALVSHDVSSIKGYVAKNVEVTSKELIISLPEFSQPITYPYPSSLGELRQREYHFVRQNKFVTGYETVNDLGTKVIILTYIKEGQSWKLQNIENDI